jgi:peptidoglycan/xylan/chitin deacetylase (PgdA/CDA1 family)
MRLRIKLVSLWLAIGGLGIAAAALAAEPASGVPILVYHRFASAASGSMTIATSDFAEQLAWLKARHIAVAPLHAVVDRLKDGEPPSDVPAVALTADDGHRSVYEQMFPLIRRYDVHVTLFIYPSAISNASYALTWEQLQEMVKSGLVDVQSHTYWHPNFHIEKRRLAPSVYEDLVRSQLALSKSRLETRLGIKVDLLAWPWGIFDAELERHAAEAGYVAAFSLERKPLRLGADLFALPRYLITGAERGPRFAALILDAIERKTPQ